jgi:hypothetical protein
LGEAIDDRAFAVGQETRSVVASKRQRPTREIPIVDLDSRAIDVARDQISTCASVGEYRDRVLERRVVDKRDDGPLIRGSSLQDAVSVF